MERGGDATVLEAAGVYRHVFDNIASKTSETNLDVVSIDLKLVRSRENTLYVGELHRKRLKLTSVRVITDANCG